MSNKEEQSFESKTRKFLDLFLVESDKSTKKQSFSNDKALNSVILFEKFRVAVEYQEEHLLVKSAIQRIVRRHLALSRNISEKKILSRLINELVWANYINPEEIDKELESRLRRIISRYLEMIRNARSGLRSRSSVQEILVGFMACELGEEINPPSEDEAIIELAYKKTLDNFLKRDKKIEDEEHELQIKLAYTTIVLKPDNIQLKYKLLKLLHPNWKKQKKESLIKVAKSIDPFLNDLERSLLHPYKKRYMSAAKRYAAPFIILHTHLKDKGLTEASLKKPQVFKNNVFETYRKMKEESRRKVWRGVVRGFIFILLTKLVLALLIEVPVDRYLEGEILWTALTINLSLPPLLMVISGLTIPKIPSRNDHAIDESLEDILYAKNLKAEPYEIGGKKRRGSKYFEYILSIFTLAVFLGVIYGLVLLDFNVVSIVLFLIFVSAVSFLSFRIRATSKRLMMKRTRQDSLTTFVELLLMPFISLGKSMSDQLTKNNPMIFFLDFVIEAPFKVIVRIGRSWINFISAKKEEMEY